jgi:hypothetical protein
MKTICVVGQIALRDLARFGRAAVPISVENRSRQQTNFTCQLNVIAVIRPCSENILLSFFRKSWLSMPSRLIEEGRTRRHDTRGGVAVAAIRCAGRAQSVRTAKSCGPGIPVLMPSVAKMIARRRGQSSRSPGRVRISRQTIAQGRSGCTGQACGSCPVHFHSHGGHGCGQHPAFPAPSASERVIERPTRTHLRREVAMCCLKTNALFEIDVDIQDANHALNCHRPRRRAIQYAAASRSKRRCLWDTGSFRLRG